MPSLRGRVRPLSRRTAVVLLTLLTATPVPPWSATAAPTPVAAAPSTAGQRLETVIERYNAVQADLRATLARAAGVSSRITTAVAQVDAAQREVSARSDFAYRAGLVNPAVLVLTAGSPADAIDRMSILDNVARASREHLDTLRRFSHDLATDRWALGQLMATQRDQQSQLARLRATIERELSTVGRADRSAPRPPAPAPVPTRAHAPAGVPGAGGIVVRFAYQQLGKPYRYATAGPSTYDCSGLALAAWNAAGVSLPHNAARQYAAVTHITRAQLRPGDLVFYYDDIQHVAIYVGGGSIIHAPEPGQSVRLQAMDYGPIHGYGRPA